MLFSRPRGHHLSTDGIHTEQVRFFTPEGDLVLTPQEEARRQGEAARAAQYQVEQERQRAEQEKQRAEQERQRAEQEQHRAEQLANKLRELGFDPTDLTE